MHNIPSVPSLNDKAGKVSFIDYEYGDYNYQECDIANHFDEMAGVEDMNFFTNYPTKEFQIGTNSSDAFTNLVHHFFPQTFLSLSS